MEKIFGASWRTTTAGVLSILSLLAVAGAAQLDGNPATDPNWMVVIPSVITAIGLLFSRDDKVTSARAGAEPAK